MFYFSRDCEKNDKKYFQSVEIGNNILIYINIKRVFQMNIDYTHAASETLKCLNTTGCDS